MTPWLCWNSLQTPLLWWLPINLCRPRRAAAKTMTGLSILWCCSSKIYAVFICGDNHQLFHAVWHSVAYHIGINGWTMITCTAWQLTIRTPDIRQGHRPVPICIRLLGVLGMICLASSCSTYFQRLGFTAPDTQSSTSFLIHRAILARQVICRVQSLYEEK